MIETQEKAVELLALPDKDFAALDGNGLTELQSKLVDLVSPGGKASKEAGPAVPRLLALGAPKKVVLDGAGEIPVLVGLRYSGRRAWEVRPEQNSLMVAVDLRTGACHSGWPLLHDKIRPAPPPSRTGPAPEGHKAAAMLTGVKRIDLRQALETELGPSRLALTVILHDWVSNTVVTEFVQKGAEPGEVAPRRPTVGLTRTSPGPGIPKLEGSGAAVTMPKDVDPGDPVIIGAAVDLPAEEAVVLPSAAEGGGSLLAATLFLRKLDEGKPVQVDLAVPAEAKGGSVRAYFEFDAARALPRGRLSGEYQVYLLTGVRVFGPYPLKVGVR